MDYQEYKKRRLRNEERLAVMQIDMLGRSFEDAVRVLGGAAEARQKCGP